MSIIGNILICKKKIYIIIFHNRIWRNFSCGHFFAVPFTICIYYVLYYVIHSPVSPYRVDKGKFGQREKYERGAHNKPQVVGSNIGHVR